jgi:hypothetical protein
MRVFISYSSKDGKSYANKLYEIVGEHGHDPFLIDHDTFPGENIWDTIGKECRKRDLAIFVLTPSSIVSKGQKQEYDLVVSFYLNRLAFLSEDSNVEAIFDRYPFLKPYLAATFHGSNFEDDCTRLASQLVGLQDRAKAIAKQRYKENGLPKLSQEGLDVSEVENCLMNMNKVFQIETIIPEICRTKVHDMKPQLSFTMIGFAYHLPIDWFKTDRPSVSNDFLFQQFGRSIALGERSYLHESILSNKEIVNVQDKFSASGILKAIEQIQGCGFKPDLIFPPLECWTSMHHWHNKAYVNYSHEPSRPHLKATLVVDGHSLRIVPPLGDVPEKTIVFSRHAITWHVKPHPKYGALSVVLGRGRLYPLKYAELIAGTKANCEIDPKGVSTLG